MNQDDDREKGNKPAAYAQKPIVERAREGDRKGDRDGDEDEDWRTSLNLCR